MSFYSPSDMTEILQNCLKNLDRSPEKENPAIAELKRGLLLRLSELERNGNSSRLETSPTCTCSLIARR
jgi:hypothetical protein